MKSICTCSTGEWHLFFISRFISSARTQPPSTIAFLFSTVFSHTQCKRNSSDASATQMLIRICTLWLTSESLFLNVRPDQMPLRNNCWIPILPTRKAEVGELVKYISLNNCMINVYLKEFWRRNEHKQLVTMLLLT